MLERPDTDVVKVGMLSMSSVLFSLKAWGDVLITLLQIFLLTATLVYTLHKWRKSVRSENRPRGPRFWSTWFLTATCALLFTGCSSMGLAKKKDTTATESAASIAAQSAISVERIVQGEKRPVPVTVTVTPPPVTVSGTNNRVDVKLEQPHPPPPQPQFYHTDSDPRNPMRPEYSEELRVNSAGGQTAGESEKLTRKTISGPALWLTLVGSGVGLILLAVGVWLWRKQSVAVNTAFEIADSQMAEGLRRLKQMAQSATDPEKVKDLNAEIAAWEASRGRLASRRGKP